WGIVSLPYSAFNPFTSTKTCLLFARKRTLEEVNAFDAAWKSAAGQYKTLRYTPLIGWALQNKRLHDRLLDLCVSTNVAYAASQHMLTPVSITTDLAAALTAACPPATKLGRKWKS